MRLDNLGNDEDNLRNRFRCIDSILWRESVALVAVLTDLDNTLLNQVDDIVFYQTLKSNLINLRIVFGKLEDYVGVLGAAALLWYSDK